MSNKRAATVFLLIPLVGAVWAQPQMDADGDGLVSRDEYQQQADERFARLDADSDGYLSPGELRRTGERHRFAPPHDRRRPLFDRADADGDGRLSVAEFEAFLPDGGGERFGNADRDADGYLTPEELRHSIRALSRRHAMQPFGDADTDGDGALSLAEIQAVRPQITVERFTQIDRNGDGLITPDEQPRPMRRF